MKIIPFSSAFLAALWLFPVGLLQAQDFVQDVEPDPFGEERKQDTQGEGANEIAKPIAAQAAAQVRKMADQERHKRMEFMEVIIDDVVRLCQLTKEQEARLRLAAKGATERSLLQWREQADRYFSNRLRGADKDSAKEILESIGSVNFGRRGADKEGEKQALWQEVLVEVLSEEQRKTYEATIALRKHQQVLAFSKMSLVTLDEHLRLTPDQKEKLQVILLDSANFYLDDVKEYWGDYYERGMLMSLANSVEDSELEKILTKKQMDRHKTATSNFDHFWEGKRQMRKKQAEEAAKKAAAAKKKEADATE